MYWIAVAEYAGVIKHSSIHDSEAMGSVVVCEDAVKAVLKEHEVKNPDLVEMFDNIPVILYFVEDEDIDEVTIDQVAVRVRGQPVAAIRLGSIDKNRLKF